MTAKDFLTEKYKTEENKIYFDDDSIPLNTTIEKICKYMTEYAEQQVKDLSLMETLTDHDLLQVVNKWAKDLPNEELIGIRTSFACGYRYAMQQVKNLNIPAVIKSVCPECGSTDITKKDLHECNKCTKWF